MTFRHASMRRLLAVAVAISVTLLWPVPAEANDANLGGLVSNPTRQVQRATEYGTPEYQARLRMESEKAFAEALVTLKSDPERNFTTDLCWSKASLLSPCLGDIRLYDWDAKGYGLVEPVLFTNRSGATISGHVWATRAGPSKRPLVVITSGAIQATEQMYWWAAQTLAKSGYIVLTSDPQNQGQSDTFGEGNDRLSGAGSQLTFDTYYDGTQDALDFMLSTPSDPYCPRPSRANISHCEKQQRRVGAGLDAAHNPYWKLVDASQIGLAGHSAGAQGVSYMGQLDKRVDAVVAWDNICEPKTCLNKPPGPAPAPRVPTLGFSEDYVAAVVPNPFFTLLGPSKKFSAARIDNGQIMINGGTHFEYSYIPFPIFTATLRGIHMTAWYTNAWFDKYLKGDPTADNRLTTTRWRNDAEDRRVDPANRGNVFSPLFKSRLDVQLTNGDRFVCEKLRSGCAGQPKSDGQPAGYDFLANVIRPDRP